MGCRVPHNKGRGAALQWLLAHVQHEGEECLIWPFSGDKHYGRGRLGINGKVVWAHRAMCEMAHGSAPSPRHQAAHNCGNGHLSCVNPKHLSWKTNSENQRDRRKHGTQGGAIGNRTRLTQDQIADIQASKGREPQLKTAARLGVKRGTVEHWQRKAKQSKPPMPGVGGR